MRDTIITKATMGTITVVLYAGSYAHGDGSDTWYGKDKGEWNEPYYIVDTLRLREPNSGMEYSSWEEARKAFIKEVQQQVEMLEDPVKEE